MLKALLIQRIFSIPTDTLLIVFLKYSQELRDFCGFDVVPDGSKFTRFKQDFLSDLQSMFDHLVDLTEPICQNLDPALASMTIFDTSGIEAWVTENNPKYANRIIKQLKAFKKSHLRTNDLYLSRKEPSCAYPGVERGSQEWKDTYKTRVNVEKSINHFKDNFCIADRKTQNEKTLHADLLLAGITRLVTVLVADKIHQYQYIRSLKPLIA